MRGEPNWSMLAEIEEAIAEMTTPPKPASDASIWDTRPEWEVHEQAKMRAAALRKKAAASALATAFG